VDAARASVVQNESSVRTPYPPYELRYSTSCIPAVVSWGGEKEYFAGSSLESANRSTGKFHRDTPVSFSLFLYLFNPDRTDFSG
jgi:hypothetical protein